ncbi:rRNA maturation RNase YbeY [Rubripirellula amarantea]|uniref:Endoribonuclease YbeY n=1 Tax=Rubripirellula amarantea TaxID=2527999 RepID=A0A5C5WUZ1_9BACT|nr:rRNA maturation RNase YbeY [Rubripirellula amarantea]MDA8744649.1 rRNA maturation RNase YbeY [Rubripirellula amarantea]TWT54428.1 Endoribonuclease YbeY [Rubripirellula amarantea]
MTDLSPEDPPLPDESDPSSATPLAIEITIDPQVSAPINQGQLRRVITAAVKRGGFHCGEIGLRITNDPTIQELNARHLDHDYPTDVISFGYSAEPPTIEGEMVVSVDTARVRAQELGWSIDNELCLYVAHGSLHIIGMDDHDPIERAAMRAAESEIMKELGIVEIERFGADVESLSREPSA